MFTNEVMIKTVLQTLGICTIPEIQRIFRGITEAEILEVLKSDDIANHIETSEITCDVTQQLLVGYEYVAEKKPDEQAFNKIFLRMKELENEIAALRSKPALRINRTRKIIRTEVCVPELDQKAIVPENQLPEIILNPDEAFEQAFAEFNNKKEKI